MLRITNFSSENGRGSYVINLIDILSLPDELFKILFDTNEKLLKRLFNTA